MSQQIQISGGAKVRNLQDVIIGTSGVLSSLAFDVANGVPKLDSNGKILVSQLPNSVMEYKGTWNAATNTPTLVNGTGNQGDVYLCNVAGTVDFGAGPIAFVVGDQVIYSGSIWQGASGATGTVTSVAITESGDSLNITGSPITTSGTINIGFNGTNLQYVNGAGNLTTFPILTGFVPYTGATANVDLGVFDLTADLITGATGSFASNGGSDTFAINHSSGAGIALNITKGGNGEGLYINKTSGSGNAATIIGTLNATTLVKNGGTSSQFLKADGTVDSNTYALDSLVVHLAGTETITGAKTFSGYTTFTSTVDITSGLTFSNSGFTLLLQPPTLSVNRTVTFADITGTIAMLEGTQTFTGTKTFNANPSINTGGQSSLSILSSTGNSALIFGYVNNILKGTIDISATEFKFASAINSTFKFQASGLGIASLIFDNTTNYSYTFPAASGTIALVGGSGVGTVTSVAALTIGTTGTDLSSTVANSTTTPVITLNVPTASATNRGALSSTDWTTFNNKQGTITLTTTGTSGAATFTSNTLNIPNYGSALSGYLPLTGGTLTGALSGTSATFSGNGAFSGVLQVAPTTGTGIIGVGDNFGGNMNAGIYRGGLGVTTSGNYLNIGGYDGVVITTGAAALGSQTTRLTIASTGAATFSGTVTAVGYSKFWDATQGLLIGAYSGGAGFGAIYSTSVTPSAGNFALAASSGTTILNAPSGGSVALAVNSTQYLQVLSTGFTFFGSLPSVTSYIKYNFYTGVNQHIGFRSSGGIATLETTNDGVSANVPMQFAASQYTFGSGGNVLIGTTTDAGGKLQVNGEIRMYGSTLFRGMSSNTLQLCGGTSSSNVKIDGSVEVITMDTNGATRLTIASTGAATFSSSVTATSFFESSDSRLKTLIQDNYQTKGIGAITPKLYTKNGKVELGYYAQDFVGILDSAVSKGSDDMLSLSYREVLVAKVYALEQRIKELETK